MVKYSSILLLFSLVFFRPGFIAASGIHARGDVSMPWQEGVYVSGGYIYCAEHFKGGLGHILHNTDGFTVRGGYRLSEYVSLEAVGRYYDEFYHRKDVIRPEWWHLVSASELPAASYHETVTVSGYDITLNVKGHLPLGIFRPYGVAGLGYCRSKLRVEEEKLTAPFGSYSGTEVWEGCLGRIGAGCDLHVVGGLGVVAEIAYSAGFGSLNNLRFVTLTAGACFCF